MFTMKQLFLPVSIRFFPKEVDRSLGVRGRLVDVVQKPFSGFVRVNGMLIQFEFYFSRCTNWRPMDLPRLPYFTWGSPEWHSCDSHPSWSIGYNPCHYCCALHLDPCREEASALPDWWEWNYISVDCVQGVLAASDGSVITWY